jgi:hypothetical protein
MENSQEKEEEESEHLSPIEQACLEFIRDVRRLGQTDPLSPEGLALYLRIKQRQAELPGLIALPTTLSIDASADESVPIHQPPSRSPKWRGETAQAKFIGRAILLTECLPFDNIVITPKKLYRVQVKSSAKVSWSSWKFSLDRWGHRAYQCGDFDVLAAVTPEDIWYLIPQHVVAGLKNFTLQRREKIKGGGGRPSADLEPYREAWHIFE